MNFYQTQQLMELVNVNCVLFNLIMFNVQNALVLNVRNAIYYTILMRMEIVFLNVQAIILFKEEMMVLGNVFLVQLLKIIV